MKAAIQGPTADAEVIRELLSPWNVSFAGPDEADIIIAYKEKPVKTKKTIVIPSDSSDFMACVKDLRSRVVRRFGEQVFVAVSSQMTLTVTPHTLYCYDGLAKSAIRETTPTEIRLNESLVVLRLDIVREYDKIVDETLNAKSSTVYRLLTGLPIPYGVAPKRLKALVMKRNERQEIPAFFDKLPMDALRFILVRAIEKLTGRKIQKKTWNGKKYACIMTHDVDTRNGLQRARYIKRLEEKYDLPSTWYIPSKRYKLNHEIIKELANLGEIGAHDTTHDGKLARLPKQKLIERVTDAKRTLERIAHQSIDGFRTPMLQHNLKILQALDEAGYTYDTSIPTWEPKHPYTMKPHGIATTYPLTLRGLTEIPVTLTQDHQLLHVLGLTPEETIRKWLDMICVVRNLGGLCTFLVHPDYGLAMNSMKAYEELVSNVASDDEAFITLPSEIARSQNANPD